MSLSKTLFIDTSSAASITLPNPVLSARLTFKDMFGLASINPITIASSNLVDGLSSTYFSSEYVSKTFFSDGISWWMGYPIGSISITINNGPNGSTATISSVVSSTMTLTGLSGMTGSSVGHNFTISNAAVPANNGTFVVSAYISATSVSVTNANSGATASDGNNGSISWSESYPITISASDQTFLINTSTVTTFNLPTPVSGRRLCFKDIKGLARTNNIIFSRNGGSYKIEGLASDYNYAVNWGQTCLLSDGTDYFFVPISQGTPVTVSSDYTISTTSSTTLLIDTSVVRNIYLPLVRTSNQMITIKDKVGSANTNAITIKRNGVASKIDGTVLNTGISTSWGYKTFLCDGIDYWIL